MMIAVVEGYEEEKEEDEGKRGGGVYTKFFTWDAPSLSTGGFEYHIR